jgi:hypothetical protein
MLLSKLIALVLILNTNKNLHSESSLLMSSLKLSNFIFSVYHGFHYQYYPHLREGIFAATIMFCRY